MRGYALPTVLIMSISILIVITALLAAATTTFSGSFQDHYQKLADEAAEAGTAYASACLTLNSHIQTWGPSTGKPNLKPATDCSGALTYASNKYLYSDSHVRSYFEVGNLDDTTNFSAQISSAGYAEVLRPDGTIAKTYASTQKKVVTWPTDTNSTMVSSGRYFTCAAVNFRAWCWGHNVRGQLGNNRYSGGNINGSSSVDSSVPVKVYQESGVLAGKNVKKIFAAGYHACALTDDGKMYCWGFNFYGQLGDGTRNDSAKPVQVGGALAGKVITDISGTAYGSCAIAEGKIYCWGENSFGTTGVGYTSTYVGNPTLVAAGGSGGLSSGYIATKLATGGGDAYATCAIADSKAYCWGQNGAGQIGDGSKTNRTSPTAVSTSGVLSGKTVTAISLDGGDDTKDPYTNLNTTSVNTHTCAIASSAVYCWGENGVGQVGDNSINDRSTPVAVYTNGALKNRTMDDVRAGTNHTCALSAGAVFCWGQGTFGQLGNNTTTSPQKTPVAVTTDPNALTGDNVTVLGGGVNRGCAVVKDGRTFCWGVNGDGQLGDGTKQNRFIPTESLFLRPHNNQFLF